MNACIALCRKAGVFVAFLLAFLAADRAYGVDRARVDLASTASNTVALQSKAGGSTDLHAVFTMTNAATGNEVVEYVRQADNRITLHSRYSTGGLGTGSGLENQGALALSAASRFLIVVNPGSNSVSALSIAPGGLTLTSQVASGGQQPISVTVRGNLVYVLNAGGRLGTGNDNISGFRLSTAGKLTPIPNSTARLASASTNPAQIGFRPDGHLVVVTEHGGQLIDLFTVDSSGVPSNHQVQSSAGGGPFGFAFRRNSQLLVSEADGGTASSYSLDAQGALTVTSGAVATGQSATCWLAITPNRRYAYVANTGSQTISKFTVAANGALRLSNAVEAQTSGGPLDLTISSDGQSLYTLTTTGRVQVFQLNGGGNLTLLQTLPKLPPGGSGIVSF